MNRKGVTKTIGPSVIITISLRNVGEQDNFIRGLRSQIKWWITLELQKVRWFSRSMCRSFVTGTLASSDISLRWWQFCVPFCWNQQILSGQDEALWYTEWVNCDITSSVHVVRLPLWTHEHKTFDSIPFCVIPVREKTTYSMFIITYIHYQLLS